MPRERIGQCRTIGKLLSGSNDLLCNRQDGLLHSPKTAMKAGAMAFALAALFCVLVAAAQARGVSIGCRECHLTGNCSAAVNNESPGVYCGELPLSSTRCCCASLDECGVDDFAHVCTCDDYVLQIRRTESMGINEEMEEMVGALINTTATAISEASVTRGTKSCDCATAVDNH